MNIYLIGFAGVGKTTIGRLLAEKEGYTFIDLDDHIEDIAKKTIPEIFTQNGEDRFREYETAALADVGNIGEMVVATGGGVVTREQNWNVMKQTGKILLLDIEFENLYNRLNTKDKDQRPLFKGRPKEDIEALYNQRRDLYKKAELSVAIDGLGIEEVLEQVENVLKSTGIITESDS